MPASTTQPSLGSFKRLSFKIQSITFSTSISKRRSCTFLVEFNGDEESSPGFTTSRMQVHTSPKSVRSTLAFTIRALRSSLERRFAVMICVDIVLIALIISIRGTCVVVVCKY